MYVHSPCKILISIYYYFLFPPCTNRHLAKPNDQRATTWTLPAFLPSFSPQRHTHTSQKRKISSPLSLCTGLWRCMQVGYVFLEGCNIERPPYFYFPSFSTLGWTKTLYLPWTLIEYKITRTHFLQPLQKRNPHKKWRLPVLFICLRCVCVCYNMAKYLFS